MARRTPSSTWLAATLIAIASVSPVFPAQAATADPLAATGKWSGFQGGAAQLPPMGWSSWNSFQTDITEEKVMGVADALVRSGLAAHGYRYLNMDDGWWQQRRADGRLQIQTNSFPSAAVGGPEGTSFRPLTDKLHAMGLKAGIYSDLGRNSCSQAYSPTTPSMPQGTVLEREVGIYGHTEQDMRLFFRDWNFDFLKLDACGVRAFAADSHLVTSGLYRQLDPLIAGWDINRTDSAAVRRLYEEAGNTLKRYRPDNHYIFSLCVWGSSNVRAWGKDVGNISRTSDDINPHWTSMLSNLDSVSTRALYAHPGSWNDPDMLEVGLGDFDATHPTEARSHFALWAMLNAPLILGNDVRKMDPVIRDIISNADIIAINQDTAGNQAVLAYDSDDIQIFVKTLKDGSKAVALFNRGLSSTEVYLTARHLKFRDDSTIALKDLWNKQTSSFTKEIKLPLAARQTLIFTARGTRALVGGTYLSEMPGSVNPAADGVRTPQPDPFIHRATSGWASTKSNGEHPHYSGWGGAAADSTPYGQALQIAAKGYDNGIGILSGSRLEVRNNGAATFRAEVGVDDSSLRDGKTVRFAVYGDGRLLTQSAPLAFGQQAEKLTATVKGVKIIELVARASDEQAPPAIVTWGDAALMK